MAVESISSIKTYFETGDKPTQAQFYSLLESNFVGEDKAYSLGVADQLDPDTTFLVITSTGGQVTLTSNPQILDGVRNQVIILVGNSDSNYVTFVNGNGLTLMTSKCDLSNGKVLVLVYNVTQNAWVEVARQDLQMLEDIARSKSLIFG